MKVLFLCGSLNPGKDGVGDYTRRLSGQLIRQGCQSIIVALNERGIDIIIDEYQLDDETMIKVVRLPVNITWKVRMMELKKQINFFNPDWLSLQYVPYAFQSKGLPFGLASQLKSVSTGRKWHIMFHELWVGKDDGQPWKMKIISFLQRTIIARMLTKLKPIIVHTHLPAYQTNLTSLGQKTIALPLFANIQQAFPSHSRERESLFRITFFSQIEVNTPIATFINNLYQNLKKSGRGMEILLLGGSAQKMESVINVLKKSINNEIMVSYTGFLSPLELSKRLNSCDIGITPVLQKGLGKSGSVAAFLEHGLPVAVPIADKTIFPFFDERLNAALVFEPTITSIDKAKKTAKSAKSLISLLTITNQFIQDLQTA